MNAGALEQVVGQADDALETSGTYQLLADDGLDVAAKVYTVGQTHLVVLELSEIPSQQVGDEPDKDGAM